MTKDEALKKIYQLLLTEPHAPTVCEKLEAIAREALAQPEQEPVEYQMRMRPTWEVSSWSDWKKCSRDAAGDYDKTPKLHDWEYETRKLYARPITQEHSSKGDNMKEEWLLCGAVVPVDVETTAALEQPEERNFCPRCGKRTVDLTTVHTCTPPQENT